MATDDGWNRLREQEEWSARSPADKVFENNTYIVEVFPGEYQRLAVKGRDKKPVDSRLDLQRIKNELLRDAIAAEAYPPESEVTDGAKDRVG